MKHLIYELNKLPITKRQKQNTNIDENDEEEEEEEQEEGEKENEETKFFIDFYKKFHQIQMNQIWFPKDLHEFLQSYNIDNFPVLNLNSEIPAEKVGSITLNDLHDLLQFEIDSRNVIDLIQNMEKQFNSDFKQMIDGINSLNIVTM
ncbi:unnamed protein product [Schistosoma mattheei]|uniref:CBS domain-containing protein n=2 Tax=Schistosoma mattheei TaxID=31246 RepID=A0AA85BDU6_9TREM|nr:unnamed protein product [Schistosoma mattheei]